MPIYKYTAQDSSGNDQKGEMQAHSREEVQVMLRQKNLVLMDVEEKKSIFEMELGKKKVKVKLDEMVIFTRQLSTMISAGIPLLESLEILHDQQTNEGFAAGLNDVVLNRSVPPAHKAESLEVDPHIGRMRPMWPLSCTCPAFEKEQSKREST